MGLWFEQYRYDASFEKGLEAVTAEYSLNRNGTVRVVNQGRKGGPDGKISESVGKAKVEDSATNAKLKVSFFGPFYGNYWVRSEEHTSELQSLMRISYAVFCLQKKNK